MALSLLAGAGRVAADSDAGEPLTQFHREWVWTTTGHPAGTGGLAILDVDRDGRVDLLGTGDTSSSPSWFEGRWYLLHHEPSDVLVQSWSSLPVPDGLRRVLARSVGAATEVVLGTRREIHVHDGASKVLLRSISTLADGIRAMAVGDVDGAAGEEIVLCDGTAVYVYDYRLGTERHVRNGFDCSSIDLGQGDGDAALEVALAGNPYGGFVLDGATFEVQWATLEGFGPGAHWLDVDGDGLQELIAGRTAAPGLRALRLADGTPVWQSPVGGGAMESADLDGDGAIELVVGPSEEYSTLHVLSAATGEELWQVEGLERGFHTLAVGQLDEDPPAEIAFSGWYDPGLIGATYVVDSGSRTVEVEPEFPPQPYVGAVAADFDADGRLELAVAGRGGTDGFPPGGVLLHFDPAARSWVETEDPFPEPGDDRGIHAMAAVELDGDPALEICLAYDGSTFEQGVRCHDGADRTTQWEVSFPQGAAPVSILVAELDADTSPELVVGASDGFLYAFEGESGWLKWRSPSIGSNPHAFVLRSGDVNGDANGEIVALAIELGSARELAIVDRAGGAVVGGPWPVAVRALDLGQIDGDEALEIVCGDADGAVAVMDPANGTLAPPIADVEGQIEALRIADTDRDGSPDVNLIADDRAMVWSLAAGKLAWTSAYLGSVSGWSDTFWVGNFDLDVVPELVVNTGTGFAYFEGPLETVFVDGFESGDLGAWTSSTP